jgi:hypothetical protein
VSVLASEFQGGARRRPPIHPRCRARCRRGDPNFQSERQHARLARPANQCPLCATNRTTTRKYAWKWLWPMCRKTAATSLWASDDRAEGPASRRRAARLLPQAVRPLDGLHLPIFPTEAGGSHPAGNESSIVAGIQIALLAADGWPSESVKITELSATLSAPRKPHWKADCPK